MLLFFSHVSHQDSSDSLFGISSVSCACIGHVYDCRFLRFDTDKSRDCVRTLFANAAKKEKGRNA